MNKKIILLFVIIVSVYYYSYYDTKKQLLEKMTSDQGLIDVYISATIGMKLEDLENMKKTDAKGYKVFFDEVVQGIKDDKKTNDQINEYKTNSYISAGIFAVALFFFYKSK